MAGADGIHTCYYSNKCQWSKAFIQEIAETPWKREFRYICVDPSPNRPALPKWLEKVPTLVIRGEDTPRTDGEVMNWLYERKMKEPSPRSVSKGSGGEGGGGGRPGPGVSMGPEEPEPFLASEMGMFAGNDYSFVDTDTNPQGDGGMTIRGAFQYLNGFIGEGEKTSQEVGIARPGAGQKSKKELQFDKQFEEFQRERDAATPAMLKRV